MKKILVLVIALATGSAHAGAIELDNQTITPTGRNQFGEQLVEVAGKCGATQVRFAKVLQIDGGLVADDQSALSITGANLSLATGVRDTFTLDSFNTLACVSTPKGPMVVLAAWCAATNCPDVNYQVIDATTVRQLTFYDYSRPCDRTCAEKALGTSLPKSLQSY